MKESLSTRRDDLRREYEATGAEAVYLEARRLFDEALAASPDDPTLHMQFGYLIECHARTQLRDAVRHFERAIELDPLLTKAHYQLISARAGLLEPEIPIALYESRLKASPDDLDSYRLLAAAYLAGHQYANAQRVIDAGLRLATADAVLITNRGEVRAGTGDVEGALADWRHARELDPDYLAGVYSSAFLLEREGRVEEAMQAWQTIIDWSDARGEPLDAIWPRQELERLRKRA